MANTILAKLFTLAATLALLFVSAQAPAATFSVTEQHCLASPGGYQWAIEQANNAPGRDTISIETPVFTVDGCFHSDQSLLPLAITESVDIAGNGNTVDGRTTWINANGNINTAVCPREDAIWLDEGGALFDIGERGTDASNVEVTISGLVMTRLTTVGFIRRNAKLTIENSQLNNILGVSVSSCGKPLINAEKGADLTLKNTDITLSSVPEEGFPSADFPLISALIAGDGGDLVMEGVSIDRTLGSPFAASVWWIGGSVKIVSSLFFESNGFWLSNSTIDFVNSVFQTSSGTASFSDNIILTSGSEFRSEASTFHWASLNCSNCIVTQGSGSGATEGLGFVGSPGSYGVPSVSFESTALGSITGFLPLQKLWGDPQVFSSDVYTWVQPRSGEDATALAAILPNASTAMPGLTIDYLAGQVERLVPIVPGVLVESVPNAASGGANELLSPIDGLPITMDIYGGPRVYANGTRNIGAVQNLDAPILSATSGDAQATLHWSPTAVGQALGYEACTSSTPLTDPLTGPCPGTVTSVGNSETTNVIGSLTNGAPYWFSVRDSAPGIWSNVATVTPMGPLGIAQPTATIIGDGSVQVFWAAPASTGGYTGLVSYNVVYRPVGTQTWILGPQGITALTTLVGGLVNGTNYEIGVMAQTDDGGLSPTAGTIVATPQAAPTLSYAQLSSWPQGSQLTLTPAVGQLQGGGAYTIESGALPDGLTLDPSTGVISGVPVTQQITGATIRLTDGTTGLFTDATVKLEIVTPSSSPQLGYPEIQATVGVGPVSATPTQFGIPAGAVWSVYPGDSLPAGFSLDSATGVISGTPITPPGKVVNIIIQACWGGCDPNAGEVRLAPMLFFIVPSLQYPANTPATAGVAATVTPTVDLWSGGVFSIESGSLPADMSLDPVTGVISGTPQTPGSSTVTIRYSTGVNVTVPPLEYVYATLQVNVTQPTIIFTYPSVSAPVDTNLSVSPTLTGLTGPPVYSIVSGPLPQGLTLDPATGVIGGVPTGSPGSYPVVIDVTGPYGNQSTSVVIQLVATNMLTPVPMLPGWGLFILTAMMAVVGLACRIERIRRHFLPSGSSIDST